MKYLVKIKENFQMIKHELLLYDIHSVRGNSSFMYDSFISQSVHIYMCLQFFVLFFDNNNNNREKLSCHGSLLFHFFLSSFNDP